MAEPLEDFNLDDDLTAEVSDTPSGEVGDAGEEQPQATPAVVQPGLTTEQFQAMLDRQAQMIAESNQQNAALLHQVLAPRQEVQVIEPPDDAEMLKAIQEPTNFSGCKSKKMQLPSNGIKLKWSDWNGPVRPDSAK